MALPLGVLHVYDRRSSQRNSLWCFPLELIEIAFGLQGCLSADFSFCGTVVYCVVSFSLGTTHYDRSETAIFHDLLWSSESSADSEGE